MKRRKLVSCVFVLIGIMPFAQTWTWTSLATMPFSTSNNAVCEAIVNGEKFVYSFGGIDTTKIFSGIHKRSFKYTVANDSWTEIDSLPSDVNVIAAGASFVNGKIYIFGGYEVLPNGNEISSNRVHVYNPATDQFESDAAVIPLAIDDHVQCVYKDSLVYLVTGWSNNGNKPNVQIFNPSLNTWEAGTALTPNVFFTAFGASGYILGDTLFYHGGAAGSSFLARDFMRKGFINSNDPTDITWTSMDPAPGAKGYRAACSGTDDRVFWVGGSAKAYNYDGIAYDGSGGVSPSARVLHFNPDIYHYTDETSQPFGVMDLRGIAKLSNTEWIICGGMDSTQSVNGRTFLLTNNSLGFEENAKEPIQVLYSENKVQLKTKTSGSAILYDVNGRQIKTYKPSNNFTIPFRSIKSGVYVFVMDSSREKIVIP